MPRRKVGTGWKGTPTPRTSSPYPPSNRSEAVGRPCSSSRAAGLGKRGSRQCAAHPPPRVAGALPGLTSARGACQVSAAKSGGPGAPAGAGWRAGCAGAGLSEGQTAAAGTCAQPSLRRRLKTDIKAAGGEEGGGQRQAGGAAPPDAKERPPYPPAVASLSPEAGEEEAEVVAGGGGGRGPPAPPPRQKPCGWAPTPRLSTPQLPPSRMRDGHPVPRSHMRDTWAVSVRRRCPWPYVGGAVASGVAWRWEAGVRVCASLEKIELFPKKRVGVGARAAGLRKKEGLVRSRVVAGWPQRVHLRAGGTRDGDLARASLETEGMEENSEEDGKHRAAPVVMVHKSGSPDFY